MLLQYGPHFFSTLSEKFGQLARFFWANGLPPPWQKIFRTPMETVNSELVKVSDRLNENKLTLNVKKSNFVIFRQLPT